MTQSQLKIFVSYRRADEKIFVELLRTHFMHRYGRENVFMDFDSIPPFARFEDFIRQKVRECDVVAVMIGKRWLEIMQERAAADEPDYVRMELEEAVKHGKVIAPICMLGAGMPPADQLPETLRPIASINAVFISEGLNLLDNISRIMNGFESELARTGAAREVVNPASQQQIAAAQDAQGEFDFDDVADRFTDAVAREDLPQALIWLAQLRDSGHPIPPFFNLEAREADLQARLRDEEERRRRREVADFQYKFVRRMIKLRDPQEQIAAAVREIWRVEPSYIPTDLRDTLRPLLDAQPPEETPGATPRPCVIDLLPQPFAWVEIPAGKVTLGGNNGANGGYIKKAQTFDVPAFAIAKYPVTNAQFAKFIEAGGYSSKTWWTDAGWEAKLKGWDWDGRKWVETNKAWTQPRYWTDNEWNGADYPVVGVSWHEVVAFCRWLGETTGEAVTLPTEQQWQRAAQGNTGWAYPWGDQWDGDRCNNRVGSNNSSGTTPVTQYEKSGASPFGIVDISGNVWEWCLTEYETGQVGVDGTNIRVLRGGSWDDNDTEAFRAAYRFRLDPRDGSIDNGFRLARSS